MITDGNWMIYEDSDPVPQPMLRPSLQANLCLRCGMRIWSGDIPIHDGWHARTGV